MMRDEILLNECVLKICNEGRTVEEFQYSLENAIPNDARLIQKISEFVTCVSDARTKGISSISEKQIRFLARRAYVTEETLNAILSGSNSAVSNSVGYSHEEQMRNEQMLREEYERERQERQCREREQAELENKRRELEEERRRLEQERKEKEKAAKLKYEAEQIEIQRKLRESEAEKTRIKLQQQTKKAYRSKASYGCLRIIVRMIFILLLPFIAAYIVNFIVEHFFGETIANIAAVIVLAVLLIWIQKD